MSKKPRLIRPEDEVRRTDEDLRDRRGPVEDLPDGEAAVQRARKQRDAPKVQDD
jgi:hypothetical protein